MLWRLQGPHRTDWAVACRPPSYLVRPDIDIPNPVAPGASSIRSGTPRVTLLTRVLRASVGVGACVLLGGGCVRTVWVNELDVPGLCPPEAPRQERSVDIVVQEAPAASTIVGLVWDAATGLPIQGVGVRLDTGARPLVVTDSAGVFLLENVAVGPNAVTVLMLGYRTRTDSVVAPERSIVRLSIPMAVEPLDGRCSGLVSVPVRRWTWPW